MAFIAVRGTVLFFCLVVLAPISGVAQPYPDPTLPHAPQAEGLSNLRYASSLTIPGPGSVAAAPEQSKASRAASEPSAETVRFRTRLFLAGTVLAVGTYGALKWWDQGLSSDFRTHSEDWFSAGTKHGGADKLGHAFGTYLGVRAGTHYLKLLGNGHDDAKKLATVTSLAVYVGIEVLDGFTKQYRFSYEDVVANVVGAGLGWLQETHPKLDALVDFRLYYRQSPEAKAEGKWEPFADYNGQRYLLAFKGSGVPALDKNPIGRYGEVLVGYGVRGYEPPGAVRSRHLYVGVGLNVATLLDDTVFRHKRDSVLRNEARLLFELFQVPGTAVFANRAL